MLWRKRTSIFDKTIINKFNLLFKTCYVDWSPLFVYLLLSEPITEQGRQLGHGRGNCLRKDNSRDITLFIHLRYNMLSWIWGIFSPVHQGLGENVALSCKTNLMWLNCGMEGFVSQRSLQLTRFATWIWIFFWVKNLRIREMYHFHIK